MWSFRTPPLYILGQGSQIHLCQAGNVSARSQADTNEHSGAVSTDGCLLGRAAGHAWQTTASRRAAGGGEHWGSPGLPSSPSLKRSWISRVCVLTRSHVKSLKFKIVAQLELFLSFILICCISQEKKPKYQIKTKSIVYPGSTGPPVADSFSGTLDKLLGMWKWWWKHGAPRFLVVLFLCSLSICLHWCTPLPRSHCRYFFFLNHLPLTFNTPDAM